MKFSNQYINSLKDKTGFNAANIEKVLRLLDVLDFINNGELLKRFKLVLKGGTAINLAFTNLMRLSVDIDLDYVGVLDKEQTIKDRAEIVNIIDQFMVRNEYVISRKTRESAILVSRTYGYTNAFENKDVIKLDINFIDRVHITPDIIKKCECLGKEVTLLTPSKEELIAMKITALLSRSKPRDLYDTIKLKEVESFNKNKIRKLVLFYLSIDNIFEINDSIFDGINKISQDSIKRELYPVISKAEYFNLESAKEEVITFLKDVLTLSENENKYLKDFAKGKYDPSLLFENVKEVENAKNHPMAKWRVKNIGVR